ncbi:MAG TPA: cell envelope integrity protein TolA [Acidobacteriaceae bacterium]|jgi:TonB family protein|nr:cell envelope integrity protein TolA [Acidobacteriaceae bacterium]
MPIRLNLTDAPPDRPESGSAPEDSPESLGPHGGFLDTDGDEPESADGASRPNGSAAVAAFRRSRYELLDHTDLLHVIDELEGSRNWASLREKLWIALILHMMVAWYLFYGPKYIYHVRVVDPSVVMKQRQKDLTFLDMPPDLIKPQKPKPTNIISDKDRRAETPHPTLDKKTLEELEAMKRAGPPVPQPAPQPTQQPQGPPPPQQQAEQRSPAPPAQPLPQNNQARLEAPPMAPKPNFHADAGNPNEQLQQAMHQAMHNGGGQFGGDGGQNAPSQHGGAQGGVDILSDTMGVDFGPYIQRIVWDTEQAWWPIIPEEARPPINKQGKVLIRFKIMPDGSVESMTLEGPSGDVALDRTAWAGITGASPYPPLPKAFKGPFLELRFYFLYNIRPGDQ